MIGGEKIGFGSDEEKALRKAIRYAFPDSKQTLCSRHMRENLKRNLSRHVDRMRASYIDRQVFEKLLRSKTESEFDSCAVGLKLMLKGSSFDKSFEKYIENLK